MIITIDGLVATGKSTVAKKLARSIGFIFFDTGAMYRSMAFGILKNKIPLNDISAIESYASTFDFDIKIKRHERHYYVDGEDVTIQIRNSEVTKAVSEVSAIPAVRKKFVSIQQELAVGVNAVFEGRDMGTVVFPSAALKIFLTGRDEVRAERRYQELRAKFPKETESLTLDQCMQEIKQRDHYDSNREHSPLLQAKDAFLIDTSELTVDEIVYKILEFKDTLKARRYSSGQI